MASSQMALGPSIRPSFAGLGSRITAYLLDLLIAFSVLILAGITMRTLRAVGLWTPAGMGDPEQAWRTLGVGAKLAIVSAFVVSGGPIYLILFEASPWQATFGKRILKIYVTDNEGRRISLTRSFGRWLAMWSFGLFGGSLISLITILTTKEKKALHDFAASTVVLSGRPTPGGNLEAWRIAAAFGISLLWIIGSFIATM